MLGDHRAHSAGSGSLAGLLALASICIDDIRLMCTVSGNMDILTNEDEGLLDSADVRLIRCFKKEIPR